MVDSYNVIDAKSLVANSDPGEIFYSAGWIVQHVGHNSDGVVSDFNVTSCNVVV